MNTMIKMSLSKTFTYLVPLFAIALVSCKSTKTLPENSGETSETNPVVEIAEKKVSEGYTEKVPETDISFEMVEIPSGSFMMGSPESEANRKPDEGPQHEVILDAFYMGKYELTWDVFELFFKQNQELFVKLDNEKVVKIDAISRPSPPYEDPSYGMGKEGYPAISMSTYSTLVFCKWLSTVTGRFYRLPTEAEWEYAARAGSQTSYSFGDSLDELDKCAVHYKNSNSKSAKVGTKLPNAWGLHDMHGNVAEWTLDEYKEDAYANSDGKNPWVAPTVFHPRVIRGGSWDDDPDKLRSAARTASSLKLQRRDPQIPKSFWWFTDSSFVGFRLFSPKEQPTPEEQKAFWQTVLDE